jgi:hypothetical protein
MKLHVRTNRQLAMRLPLPHRMVMWLAAACFMAIPFSSFAGVFISVAIAPPPLPIYAQPIVPGPGYIWTPGYWSYASDGGYFWVPGTWVLAPYAGALWTPGYWGWNNGFYVFNGGYWGPHVGFYGGINYGYGYGGRGYSGGYWNHGSFNYNRTVINNTTINRVSFNGGRGGLNVRPSAQEQLAVRDRHMEPLAAQQQQIHMASQNTAMRASVNHGAPAIAATQRPGAFSGGGVVGARGANSAMGAGVARANASSTHTARVSDPATSRGNVTAQHANGARTSSVRSSTNAPRNTNVQRTAQSSHATARPTHTGNANQGSARQASTRSAATYHPAPAAHSTQQARPQAQARPQPQARQQPQQRQQAHGGNQGEHKPQQH